MKHLSDPRELKYYRDTNYPMKSSTPTLVDRCAEDPHPEELHPNSSTYTLSYLFNDIGRK